MTDNNNSQYARVLSKQSLLCLSLSSSIGIGVFLIVSHVSKECGNLSWLAMLCAGIFSIMTAYSYAELSSIFNSNSTEYEYIKYASKSNKLATLASVIIIVSELLILATIAIGLGHYCKDFIPLNENIIAVFAVLIFNYLNYRGIKTSADFSKYALSVKIGVIVLLIFIGIYKIKTPGVLIEKNKNVSNLIKASTLGLFSFIGFTGSISLTEEAKNPSDIPEVIILTTLITTFLYIALTIALLVGLGSTALSNSSSPLADISFIYFGNYGYIIFKALIIVALLDSLLITSIKTTLKIFKHQIFIKNTKHLIYLL